MTSFREGQALSYIGDGSTGLPLGAHGRLLAFASATHGHVQWLDGPCRGQVTFHSLEDDFAPAPKRYQAALASDGLEDSLEVGPVEHTSARHTFDVEGPQGVLSMLASTGHLASFDAIADEVLAFTEGRIRQEASIRDALVQLDEDEGADLVSTASRILLRDAFGAEDEDD